MIYPNSRSGRAGYKKSLLPVSFSHRLFEGMGWDEFSFLFFTSPDTEEIVWTWYSNYCTLSIDFALWARCTDRMRFLGCLPWRRVKYFLCVKGIPQNYFVWDEKSNCLPSIYWSECLFHFSFLLLQPYWNPQVLKGWTLIWRRAIISFHNDLWLREK